VLNVLLGISGGISAYKATGVIRAFTELGHSVKVVPTQNALRFIGATTLEALSHNAVDPDLFTDVDSVKHVALGQEADLVVVSPATAAFLARYAGGVADDLLLNTLLVTKAPVVVAPAMHTEMWQHPATQQNVAILRARGVFVMEPDSGRLTGSDTGPGRLPEASAIVSTALAVAKTGKDFGSVPGTLQNKRVLITAGGTQEPIDPVRFIGNHSSGKQGLALAHAAKAAGARVTLIGANLGESIVGNSANPSVSGVDDFVAVQTAAQLQEQVESRLESIDVLIMAAAVSDFRVEHPITEKIKRSDIGHELELKLVANPDILAGVSQRVAQGGLPVTVVGFAAETAGNHERLAALAAVKLESKKCHVLIANDVAQGAVFGQDHNSVYMISKSGEHRLSSGTKLEVAVDIVAFIASVAE
jgi:phosphopantothenoylcysteine decarboxylase/phosphopantothenate--cysteine ligase